jgi:excisionase family DNA binding protein
MGLYIDYDTTPRGSLMLKATLTVDEAAVILGVSRNSAYQAARTGELPVIKIGKRLLVPRVAFERLLDIGGSGTNPSDTGGVTAGPGSMLEGLRSPTDHGAPTPHPSGRLSRLDAGRDA